jgi:hypothetical protein
MAIFNSYVKLPEGNLLQPIINWESTKIRHLEEMDEDLGMRKTPVERRCCFFWDAARTFLRG